MIVISARMPRVKRVESVKIEYTLELDPVGTGGNFH